MDATEQWNDLVAHSPDVAAAFAGIGTRGGDRRSRVRRRAGELDVTPLTIPEIAWELQSAAADGAVRDRITAAHARYRHDVRTDQQRTVVTAAPKPGAGSPAAAGSSRGHTAWFVVLLIVAFFGPALMLPSRSGGGFAAELDQVALLSGAISVVMSIVGLVYVRRASRPLVGMAVPLILAIWVVVGLVIAGFRVAADPQLAGPSVIAGLVLMVAAAVIDAVSAFLVRGTRRAAPAAPVRTDETAAALAEAVAGEDADAAMIRRAAYADGILTLMKRDELDADDAETLLRVYAV